jgi:hypothetical protein
VSTPAPDDDVLQLGPEVAERARQRFPELYRAAVTGRGTFDAVLQARRLRRSPMRDREDWWPSHWLEGRLRSGFEAENGAITHTFWCRLAYGGAVVTDRGVVTSSLQSHDEELMTIEVAIKQAARDAQRTFADEDRRASERSRAAHRATLAEVSATLFSALTRVLDAADVLADPQSTSEEKKAARQATRAEWRLAQHRTAVLIQRQARLEYFVGVLLGAPLAIAVFAVLGALAANLWPEQLSASSFVAATVCGALGAVVSVTQRMATGRLKIDYTASALSKVVLGAWRPFLGGVLGGVLQFAVIGGLLTVQGREPSPDSPATFAFYALIGFAGGFSERLATDLLERAGQLISPTRTPEPESGADDPTGPAPVLPLQAPGRPPPAA